MNTAPAPTLILASTSPFRKELLGRLNLPFETAAPDVDESRLENEPAVDLVRRLSEAKARAIGATHSGLIIGSDQVATHGESILGKPGDHDTAMRQLQQLAHPMRLDHPVPPVQAALTIGNIIISQSLVERQ